VQAGAGDFTHGIKPFDVGARHLIDHYAAATVMCRRYHRNRLLRDVDAQLQATRVNVRKVFLEKISRFVRNIPIYAIQPAFFHLEINGTRHNVTRRQFGAFIVLWHEARAVRQHQNAALASHRFGNQKRLGMRVIQAGGMELDELHIRHAAAGAPTHRNTVAGGNIRIGGVKIRFAGAA